MSIKFYNENDKYGEFSNFYPQPIKIDGVMFPTSEHYFQCMKFYDKDIFGKMLYSPEVSKEYQEYFEIIRTSSTPGKAKILASQKISTSPPYPWRISLNKIIEKYDKVVKIRSDWEQVKDNIMRTAVFHKFYSSNELKKLLISTENAVLIEHTNRDNYWGDGGNNTGKNMLGIILMETRTLLQDRIPKMFITHPFPRSNWIIEHIFLVSSLPENRFPELQKNILQKIVSKNIDIIINLQETNEKNIYYEKLLTGQKMNLEYESEFYCQTFELKEEFLNFRSTPTNKITFIRFPIPDRSITDDAAVYGLCLGIVAALGEGHKILVHCMGGKGRSNTIAAITLGILYHINSDIAIDLVLKLFNRRENKGKSGLLNFSDSQISQIKSILDH